MPRHTLARHPERSRGTATKIEPLAALYDRAAFLREGLPVLLAGDGSLHSTVERLRARYVTIGDAHTFTNVNTPQEYDAVRSVLS